MSLSALATPTARPAQGQCSTCWVLTVLDEPHKTDLIGALSNGGARYSAISEALEQETGHHIPGRYLSRHARGECEARVKMRGVAK